MKIAIEEFKQLIDLLSKPIKVDVDVKQQSITIACKAKPDDTLERPIVIENTTIKKLGVYRIQGQAIWIVKQ